jgi:hypothetical protein
MSPSGAHQRGFPVLGAGNPIEIIIEGNEKKSRILISKLMCDADGGSIGLP